MNHVNLGELIIERLCFENSGGVLPHSTCRAPCPFQITNSSQRRVARAKLYASGVCFNLSEMPIVPRESPLCPMFYRAHILIGSAKPMEFAEITVSTSQVRIFE